MKTSTIGFALLHLAGFSYAAPGSGYVDARQTSNNNVFYVFFSGAGSNPPGFELEFPSNGSTVAISKLPTTPFSQRCWAPNRLAVTCSYANNRY